MKRRICIFISLIFVILCFTACNKKDTSIEWNFNMNIARAVTDDGWVYTFSYQYPKNENESDDIIPFNFYGVNLRYRYNDNYYETVPAIEDGKEVTKKVPAVIQMLGGSNSPGIEHDMEKIAEILDYENCEVTKEDLLSINQEEITFEELDKDLFFGLIDQALNGEAHEEGNYVLPVYALLSEPEYIDEYKFQIGFVSDMGTVDVIYIDVLYKTGSEYNEYVQLSDLVDNGTATDEQKQAFEIIENISKGIVDENNLMYGYSSNNEKTVADIDFSRLYTFLKDIENYNYSKYMPDNY